MKIIKAFLLVFSLLSVVGSALAIPKNCDIVINDASVITGTWLLYSTRPTRVSGSKKTSEIWQFGSNGVFKLTAKDFRASGTLTNESSYSIENNNLKIARIGRPGKFDSYKLCEKNDNGMIMFGGLEGYYFFSKN